MTPIIDHWGRVDADLDTLLIALYVELTDRIVPARRPARRRGPGRPPAVTDAELVCLAVAQVLLRFDDERRWLRAAARRVGHLFPRLVCQMEAALRFLAAATPSSGDVLRLMDGAVSSGQCVRLPPGETRRVFLRVFFSRASRGA